MRTIVLTVSLFMSTLPLWAATINLKSGQTVEGTIIEQTVKSVKVEVNGARLTYFADEIQDIDGKSFASISSVAPEVSQVAPTVVKPIDPQKKALILQFIDAFGTRQALKDNFNVMIKKLPPERADEAEQLRQRIKIDEIIERLIPIYDQQFSVNELQTYINFYSSEEGKKLLKSIPVLMGKSVAISAAYIQEKFPASSKKSNP